MPDQNTWLMHRDQMELLNRIESLLTVAHHERRAIRAEMKVIAEMIKSHKLDTSTRKASFDWRLLMDSTLARLALTIFLGGTGIVAWSEAIKVALQ